MLEILWDFGETLDLLSEHHILNFTLKLVEYL